MLNSASLGKSGELYASEYLIKNGYKIIEKNFRYKKFGEIDIIAKDKEYICFIEVKTRRNVTYGTPAESITAKKIKKIRSLSQLYTMKHGYSDIKIRFDVIEVFAEYKNNKYIFTVNVIKNAF